MDKQKPNSGAAKLVGAGTFSKCPLQVTAQFAEITQPVDERVAGGMMVIMYRMELSPKDRILTQENQRPRQCRKRERDGTREKEGSFTLEIEVDVKTQIACKDPKKPSRAGSPMMDVDECVFVQNGYDPLRGEECEEWECTPHEAMVQRH